MNDDTLSKAEISSRLTVYKALLSGSAGNIGYVLDDIRTTFGGMLAVGASSLWEAERGAEAFARAGSLCHGWASVLNYVAGAYVLGVRPISPGFETFTVEPMVGALPWAEGVVPTPKGLIRVKWCDTGKEVVLTLRHPRSLEPKVKCPKGRKLVIE